MIQQEKGNNVRTLNKMKSLTSVGTPQYVTERLNTWFKNHKKDYLTNEDDLADLIRRYNKHIARATLFAHLFAFSAFILILLIGWIKAVSTKEIDESILPSTLLIVVIWIITRYGLGSDGENMERFDSLRRLHLEWKRLEELHSRAQDNEAYLRYQGEAIATAERRQDKETKKRLKEKFGWDHLVLTNFGVCKAGYEFYIPISDPAYGMVQD